MLRQLQIWKPPSLPTCRHAGRREQSMSAEEALTARLADLESDSFQLKLRNYYLERRVSKELGGERRGETALRGLLATAP